MSSSYLAILIVLICLVPVREAYTLCQAACTAGVVACYAAAGLVFGTVIAGAGASAAALTCNTAVSQCMAGCDNSVKSSEVTSAD